jgi:HSP20 family protein
MNNDPKKWNPFKFIRGSIGKSGTDGPDTQAASEQGRATWPDIQRLFSRDSLRAMEDFFLDEGKILRVTVELPGMEREDLTISIEDGALVLRGEKRQDVHSEEDGCYRLERAYGAFTRTIPMPENADADHTLAKFDKGVLTLTVPKHEALRSASRTIDIG